MNTIYCFEQFIDLLFYMCIAHKETSLDVVVSKCHIIERKKTSSAEDPFCQQE